MKLWLSLNFDHYFSFSLCPISLVPTNRFFYEYFYIPLGLFSFLMRSSHWHRVDTSLYRKIKFLFCWQSTSAESGYRGTMIFVANIFLHKLLRKRSTNTYTQAPLHILAYHPQTGNCVIWCLFTRPGLPPGRLILIRPLPTHLRISSLLPPFTTS